MFSSVYQRNFVKKKYRQDLFKCNFFGLVILKHLQGVMHCWGTAGGLEVIIKRIKSFFLSLTELEMDLENLF